MLSGRSETKGEEDGDLPLELEHMLGFTGQTRETLLAHPTMPEVYIKSMGSAIVVGDLNDPHQQEFLRGHDMEISCLAVAPSGAYLASGQLGTTHRKGYGAPVIIWDLPGRRPLFTLQGHTVSVDLLRFSPDEKFVAACGQDCLLHIWDLATGEVLLGKKFPKPVALFVWGEVSTAGRRAKYDVCVGAHGAMDANELSFDPGRQQWALAPQPMAVPSSGLARDYLCACLSSTGDELIAGTTVGDLVVFKLQPQKVYRASVPVCSGGLRAVVAGVDGLVFCGGGDGSVRKLRGDDLRWSLLTEAQVEGAVTSLAPVANGRELLVATAAGRVYRMLTEDLSCALVAVGHTNKVSCVAFGTRSDVFASGTCDGNLKVWDLSDYGVISECTVAAEHGRDSGGCVAVCWIRDEAVVSGWADASLRCHDASNMRPLWELAHAHRAPVTCVAAHADPSLSYVASAAADGSVRVWALRTREMMLQFCEHSKAVTGLVVDCKQPHLLHSAGLDCQVLTYDLRKERRTVGHLTREGQFTSLSQRTDSEQELVTCDAQGRLLFWDCDVADPVQALQSPQRMKMTSVAVSPSGAYLAVAGDSLICIFDLQAGTRLMAQGRGHSDDVAALRWSPDEKQVLSVGDDCCICVWNFYGEA